MKKLMLVLCFAISINAYSQVEKGDKNLSFNALYLGAKDVGVGLISAKIGYYITRNIEFGVTSAISFVTIDGEKTTSPGGGAYLNYNFLTPEGIILPYLGASVDFLKSGDITYITGGGYAGAKFFIKEKVNIDVGLKILVIEEYTFFLGTVGIGFILGGNK